MLENTIREQLLGYEVHGKAESIRGSMGLQASAISKASIFDFCSLRREANFSEAELGREVNKIRQ